MSELFQLAEETQTLSAAIENAREALLAAQRSDGHWCFELEADCTIPAEYIIMMHYLDEIDVGLERKMAVYLREKQNDEGGWPLYHGGKAEISCTVKVYYALKMTGDDPNAPHMQRARACILNAGGAAQANVFTRITLALFGQVPWRAVPFIPVEVMLLPGWFPFHINKVSYWSRTVMVPLFILCSLKPRAKNPRQVHIPELFTVPADQERHYFKTASLLGKLFLMLDKIGRGIEPLIPKKMRRAAIARAERWFTARLNGEDGLGAIFPAMVNAYEALLLLGYAPDHPYCTQARQALKKLVVEQSGWAYCQPCFSPVWDTALTALALQAEGSECGRHAAARALDWLQPLQILDGPADWCEQNPRLAPGGWAFEYHNNYYPDLDDTAVVGWAMWQQEAAHFADPIRRAADWLAGMQSRNGGFAAFDKNNLHYYLNEIPFADHGALLDPPTSDVTARCVSFFGRIERPQDQAVIERSLEFLFREQELNGSWFGRWGTNYIYGTWSVLTALEMVKVNPLHPAVRLAVDFLQAKQHADGGWGESNDSYEQPEEDRQPSTSYQTAWALLGLMAAGEVHSAAVARGIRYLLRTQKADGFWHDAWFTAPGFPRVFYLRYHGYCKYFPLWALAQYRRLALKTVG
jgi:squalene-hopene/tetraprenyl-beta-curcumene cyclase